MSLIAMRHAQLFELLRQQNICDQAQARSRTPVNLSPSEFAGVMAISQNSLASPKPGYAIRETQLRQRIFRNYQNGMPAA